MLEGSGSEITVLTPSLNYGRFLSDALDSVAAQRDVVVSHVVQDALSSDDTTRILRQAQGNVHWTSELDEGQSDALNRAYSQVTAGWVAWLNADEFYMPGALALLLDTARATNADVVYGDCVFVDERGRFERLVPQHRFSPLVLRWYGAYISSCCALFRRDALPPHPWSTRFRRIMDWELYLRLLEAGARFVHVPRPIGAFRLHDARVTARPHTDFLEEFQELAETFGAGPLQRRIFLGKLVHGGRKLVNGAYRRQLLSRSDVGRDFRWFDNESAMLNVRSFMSRAYGIESAP